MIRMEESTQLTCVNSTDGALWPHSNSTGLLTCIFPSSFLPAYYAFLQKCPAIGRIIYHRNEWRHSNSYNLHMCKGKTQISLYICAVWSDSLPCALWIAKGPKILHAMSQDADQTARMCMMVWVICKLKGLLCPMSLRLRELKITFSGLWKWVLRGLSRTPLPKYLVSNLHPGAHLWFEISSIYRNDPMFLDS